MDTFAQYKILQNIVIMVIAGVYLTVAPLLPVPDSRITIRLPTETTENCSEFYIITGTYSVSARPITLLFPSTKYSTNILAGKKYSKNYLCLVLKIMPGYHHSPVKCEHDPDALVAGLDPVHRVSVADHHSPVNMIRMPWLLALLPSTGSV